MNWERILFGVGVWNLVLGAVNVVVDEGNVWLGSINILVGLMCLYFAKEGDNG